MSTSPLGYLDAAGPRAGEILPLTWFTLIVSVVVCCVIGALLWVAVRRKRPTGADSVDELEQGGDGMRWISLGLLISALPLTITLVWTMRVLAAVVDPPEHPAVVLDVTARQWWWAVRYNGAQTSETFETANEIHIPVGRRVLVRLHTGDVIHSFWVPKLTGKTDVIPGQTSQSWMQADSPGRYLGQCSEFCGYQHSHMQLEVVAQSAADFARWQAAQRAPAAAPSTTEASRGLRLIEDHCIACHRLRDGNNSVASAPDLTHLMSRATLAAGTVPNTAENLIALLQDPQDMKPGSLMPKEDFSEQQLSDLLAYLISLK